MKNFLSNHINNFLEYCEITKNQSPKTLENYKHYLQRFSQFTGPKSDPADLNLQKIQDYRLYLNRLKNERNHELGTKTQNYHLIALRAFLKYLVKNDIPTLAPEKIELGKIPERTVEALSEEELARLFAAAEGVTPKARRDMAILETLYSTGLRVTELVNLDIEKVDLERREFMVRGKGRKPRIVFLSERAVERIKSYLETRKDNFKPLFINSGKGQSSDDILNDEKRRLTRVSIEKIVRTCGLKAGIIKKVTPHILRHSYATNLLIRGADIRSVQELLGHSSITTTQVYTHLTNRKLREIHEKFHQL